MIGLCGFILLALFMFNNVFAKTWHSIYFCPGGKASFTWDEIVAIEYCQFGGALKRGIDVNPLHARVDINSGFSKSSASLISPRVEFVGNLSSGDWNFTLKNISKADGKNYSLSCQERNKSPRRIFFNLIARPKENCTKTSVTVVNDTRVNTTSIPVVNDTRVNTTSIPKPEKPTGPIEDIIFIAKIVGAVGCACVGLAVIVIIWQQRNERLKNKRKSLEEGSGDGHDYQVLELEDQSYTESDGPEDVNNEQRNERLKNKNKSEQLSGDGNNDENHKLTQRQSNTEHDADARGVPGDLDNESDASINEQRNGNGQIIANGMAGELRSGGEMRAEPFQTTEYAKIEEKEFQPYTPSAL